MTLITSFRAARWFRTANLAAQAVLLLTFFSGLNYLAVTYAWRFELSTLRRQALSAETQSYLRQLKAPVRVVVTLTKPSSEGEMSQVFRDVSELLRDYAYLSERNPAGRVTVEFLDVDRRPGDARQLNASPDTVLFLCGDRRREVQPAELYRFKDRQRVAFLGEQVFTSAILDVTSREQKRVYFLTGHGEYDLGSVSPARGLSVLRDALRERNLVVESLNLARERKIPEDAAVIVVAGPDNRVDSQEQELLRQYLANRAGRVLLLLKPGVPDTGLEDLLFEWGLVADNVWIQEPDPSGKTDANNLILRDFLPHPITQLFVDNALQVKFGAARSVRPNPSRPDSPGLNVARLVRTSAKAWGERDYMSLALARYATGFDLAGPLSVLSVAERTTARDNLPFSVPIGRLVAFGSSDFVTNGRIGELANLDLFFASLNWLADRDTQLNVPVRKIDRYQLALSAQQLRSLRLSLLFIAPAAAAMLGGIVYLTRRR
ncbi:MAG: GldG family protein [Opitutaceae bacterium]|nr:GldG family protein [Opitutaceae bacterium]